MKKGILITMILTLILTTGILPAHASNKVTEPAAARSEESDELQRIVHQYSKTIVYYYSDFNSIPTTTFYQELDEITQTWFRGTLDLQTVVREYSNGHVVWKATYSGTLTGNI